MSLSFNAVKPKPLHPGEIGPKQYCLRIKNALLIFLSPSMIICPAVQNRKVSANMRHICADKDIVPLAVEPVVIKRNIAVADDCLPYVVEAVLC